MVFSFDIDVSAISVVCIDENLCGDDCCLLVDKGKIVVYESTVVGSDSVKVISSEEDRGFVLSPNPEKNFDVEGRVSFRDLVLSDISEECNGVDERERCEEDRVVLVVRVNGDRGCRVEETLSSTDDDDEYLWLISFSMLVSLYDPDVPVTFD